MRRPICRSLLLPLLLAGCVDDLGQFCREDSDCHGGLRCSGTPNVRGVCTYPEALGDTVIPRDGGPRDAAHDSPVVDGTIDGPKDAATDARFADAPAADTLVDDARIDVLADGTARDGPNSDALSPDATVDALAAQ